MSVYNYWLFFHPFARRARGVLSDSLDVVLSTPDVRKNIIAIVNSMWDTGIPDGMETLPSVIAPNSTVCRTDSADIMASNNPKSARYAVGFFILSDIPFHVTDLSFMLLRFQDFHIRDSDYYRFNLISLSYHIGVDGTYGLLLYDRNLVHAYCKALHLSRQDPARFKSSHFGHPISTWPPDSDSIAVRTNKNISDLMRNIQ
ncbi:hypothetical protein B0H13DRAFT_2358030 [Mycena leptocephala]|nr:hypothetical protein B0H13DRAFT_2358030 [Mycena leptocephala]